MQEIINDEFYMDLAISMASKSMGQTGINPIVGCVIVKDGRIVGLGAHLRRGEGHAEVNACKMAGDQAEGATAYVTLEPCSHHGKTPPCSDLLIKQKVARVVIAAVDPNPLVAGTGIKRLEDAGIEVKVGVLADKSNAMNEKFNKYIMTKLPYVTLKSASTLDGKLATKTGSSQWISGPEARAEVHTLRHQHEGIMVGIETVLQDNPSLSTRLDVPGISPVPIIVDSLIRIPTDAKLLELQASRTIILTTTHASPEKQAKLEGMGVTVVHCGSQDKVDLQFAMKWLGEHEISSILLEGGGKLNGAMLEQKYVDKVVLYYGMKIVGGFESPSVFSFSGVEDMSKAISLERVEAAVIGQDVRITGYPQYEA